jgi:hypothetical protein
MKREKDKEKGRKIRWAGLPARVVFFVCDAMIRHRQKAKWIVDEVLGRFGEKLARTQVTEVFYEGLRRGYFQLTPPRDEWLAQRMLDVFGGAEPWSDAAKWQAPTSGAGLAPRTQRKRKNVKVICQGSDVSLLPVATAAAELTLEVIMAIHKKLTAGTERRSGVGKDLPIVPVHIGFGGGASMNLVARYLAERLRSLEAPPPLVIHALTSGFNVREPDNAPGSFFSFFQGTRDVSFRGLFAPAYVNAEDWDKTRRLVGVRESFAEKNELHVIVTALASRHDFHGELNSVMRLGGELGEQTCRILDDEEKRIGDVLYRPFAAHGPITRQAGIRAVTLFELPELVTFAAGENKAVILVAGPCADRDCRRSRSDALLPLLREPSLDVWSHLVTDDRTALECLPKESKDRS